MSRYFFGTHRGHWMLRLRINQGYLTERTLFTFQKKEKKYSTRKLIKLDPVIRNSENKKNLKTTQRRSNFRVRNSYIFLYIIYPVTDR